MHLLELRAEPATFFHEAPFLFERASYDYSDLIIPYLADTFLQMNEVSLSLKGKQLTIFVTIEFSSESFSSGKFVSATQSLTASQNLRLLMRSVGINECNFLNIIQGNVVTFGRLYNSVNNIFPVTNAKCYKIMHD